MGGTETDGWLAGLGASFDAALAREEDVAADDLAFSFRQDGDLRATTRGRGWVLLLDGGEAAAPVEEVGADFVSAGGAVVPVRYAALRSAEGASPRLSERTLSEVLGAACRSNAWVEARAGGTRVEGRLVKAGRDHVVLRRGATDVVLGLDAIAALRLEERAPYSDSRGLRG